MNLTDLLVCTALISAAVYDGIVVYVLPALLKRPPNVNRSISRFMQKWPTRSPFLILVTGFVMGHFWGFLPCPECPRVLEPVPAEVLPAFPDEDLGPPQLVMAAAPHSHDEQDEAAHAATHHGQPRSPNWPTVRAKFMETHSTCAACGATQDLQVHHVLPFHDDPAKELDPTNLITLCGPGKHNCHLRFGHLFNFHCQNPHVREDAAAHLKRIKDRQCD